MHISGIETGKVVPRFDALLGMVRVFGHDLLLAPRELLPMVRAITRDRLHVEEEQRPLYAQDNPDETYGPGGGS